MSQLTQQLRAYADTLHTPEVSETEAAVELLKQAGLDETTARTEVLQMEMEKEAAEHLVMQGIDVERAVAMVKAANIKVKELTNISLTKEAVEANPEVELLLKVAEYAESLEAEVENLKNIVKIAKTDVSEPEVKLPESLEKVAKSGMLTKEDLIELQTVSPGVLEKVASAFEQPWEMGKAAGVARPKTDPILEFCLG